MSDEAARAFVSVLVFLGSTSFIVAAIRAIFSFGQLVKGQQQLTDEAKNAAASFKEFAGEIRKLLMDHDARLSEVEKWREVQTALQEERRTGHGRRADDH